MTQENNQKSSFGIILGLVVNSLITLVLVRYFFIRVPQLDKIYMDMNVSLPFVTQVILSYSHIIVGLVILALIVTCFMAAGMHSSTPFWFLLVFLSIITILTVLGMEMPLRALVEHMGD